MTSATALVPRKLLARDERQASILRGAATAFARTGYAATSMEDVAEACGVTKLIVYRHFESKEELYRSVLQRVFDRQAELFIAGMAAGQLRGVSARSFLTVAREDPDAFVLLWRHASREPQFAEYARDHRAIVVEAAHQIMAADLGDEVVELWAAESVIGFLIEAVLAWLEVGDPARDAEAVERITAALRSMRDALVGRSV